MSSQEALTNIILRFTHLYNNCHLMSPSYVLETAETISAQTLQMVIDVRNTRRARVTQLAGPYTAHNNPLEKCKAVSKKMLEEKCPSQCAICQDIPKHKDAICTECNHYYCKECWEQWMNTVNGRKYCPTCRKSMPRITSYRARVAKKIPMKNILSNFIIED